MYPFTAHEYYLKRGEYLRDVEEYRLRELIKAAIPLGLDGWNQNLPQPPIIIKCACATPQSQTPDIKAIKDLAPLVTRPSTGPSSSTMSPNSGSGMTGSVGTPNSSSPDSSSPFEIIDWPEPSFVTLPHRMEETPLLLEELARPPPSSQDFVPRPPQQAISVDAKLLCLARWTHFDAPGNPYLACEPREKRFEMSWARSDAEDAVLVKWAKEMWWHVWARQFRVNYGYVEKEIRKGG
jgi:hypothetical protein